jgi:putative ABC transport system permease protein
VARSVSTGIASEGQSILGGDVSFALNQREASVDERAFIEKQGRMAESATMRSMARLPDGSDQSLVEVKAVDAAYPL